MPAALTAAVLTLDAALDGCSAGVVLDGAVVAEARYGGGRGSAAVLPELARAMLAKAGVAASSLDMIAVTVGPGSFTGVRAALALAQGIGLAAGVPVRGVSIGDAIRTAVPDGGQVVWVAVDSRRGRVFLDTGDAVTSLPLASVPSPAGPVSVAGNAGAAVAARLVAGGHDAKRLAAEQAEPLGIMLGAVRHGRPAVPLYVDPVEARPSPAPRPAPA